jgi:hypothetical protein
MTCPPCTHDCDQGETCPIRVKERERIIAANAPEIEKANAHIKRLEDQAYDLLGQLKVANIKLSMRPQRTWVGLTDDEIAKIGFESADRESAVIQTIDKLKEKNNG